jgi:hypothetical protein
MTNIDIIGIDKILLEIPTNKKYRLLNEQETVKENDLIAMVSITSLHKKTFQVTWHKPETIGELKKFSGKVVIREIDVLK